MISFPYELFKHSNESIFHRLKIIADFVIDVLIATDWYSFYLR